LRGINSGTNEDGSIVEFQFHRQDGSIAYVQLPTIRLATVFEKIQETAAMAYAQQRKVAGGADPRSMTPIHPMKVTRVQGAAAEGKPILSLEINGSIRMDLALEDTQVAEMIEWLGQLRQIARVHSPRPH
jgi:hypothetical protein